MHHSHFPPVVFAIVVPTRNHKEYLQFIVAYLPINNASFLTWSVRLKFSHLFVSFSMVLKKKDEI